MSTTEVNNKKLLQ